MKKRVTLSFILSILLSLLSNVSLAATNNAGPCVPSVKTLVVQNTTVGTITQKCTTQTWGPLVDYFYHHDYVTVGNWEILGQDGYTNFSSRETVNNGSSFSYTVTLKETGFYRGDVKVDAVLGTAQVSITPCPFDMPCEGYKT